MKRLGHGLQGQINYTWSRCMDTVSNGGFLQFSAGGILSPLPGDSRATTAPATTTSATISPRNTSISCRSKYAAARWATRSTAGRFPAPLFWHSGIPFSVLSTPYSARTGTASCRAAARNSPASSPALPLYSHHRHPRRHAARHASVAQSQRLRLGRRSQHRRCTGGDNPANCQFGNLGRNALRGPDFFWSDFYLTKWFPLTEHVKLRFDAQFFNLFNHPNFGLPSIVLAGIPGKPSTQTGFGALTYTTSPPTGLLGVGLGGDSTPRMIAFQARLEF